MNITAHWQTDPGLVRSNNEDSCLVINETKCYFVADGMGGEASGEIASGLMKETVQDFFSIFRAQSTVELKKHITGCLLEANSTILHQVTKNPVLSGMGCTAELLVFTENEFVLGHVGDSRTYLFREGSLRQLTRDHTLVQEQLDLGVINETQARKHSLRHVVTRAIGANPNLEIDVIQNTFQQGDIFLLCSDGLTSMVEDNEIAEIIAYNAPPQLKTDMLVTQANNGGGRDNTTVVLIEIA